ncbi:ATP-binding cassette domain-containing protein [Alteromonas sp. BL110]|uniref:ABC transporter ATP-binding protein n=1 Tax=Alteromonas sp. BL110 TaxID=1714845 RepID=UPI000E4F65E2|nr:ATP-binding cassette domain-containing protein [Alteromonas sp. BL110]AXT39281.1 ATP-binding cassette domain-containing protein [Alteromonas sp. BL110]RKM82235.1 ATP-binding cassette domain-containing protein [Alteromonas sp. BL110]
MKIESLAQSENGKRLNTALLTLKDVVIARGEKRLIEPLSLSFHTGEFTAIAGENGCGKSTLLSMLSGVETPSSGTLTLAGRDISSLSANQLAKQRAVMAQSASTPFGFIADELLHLARYQHIESLEHKSRLINLVAEQFDITHLLARNIQTLSGGERQRIFLAKAVLQILPSDQNERLEGKLLLLDEPTSALDLRHQKLVMQQLVALRAKGLCIVCVSHDLNLISPYCDRLILLGEKQCLADGAPAGVLTTDMLSRCYHTQLNLIKNEQKQVFVTH